MALLINFRLWKYAEDNKYYESFVKTTDAIIGKYSPTSLKLRIELMEGAIEIPQQEVASHGWKQILEEIKNQFDRN